MIEMMFCENTRKVVDVWCWEKREKERKFRRAEWEDGLGWLRFLNFGSSQLAQENRGLDQLRIESIGMQKGGKFYY